MGDPLPGSVRYRVLVADDHRSVRDALAALISTDPQLELVASVADGDAALATVGHDTPDVAVVDHHMPGGGVELVRELRQRCPDARIIVLSAVAEAYAEAYRVAGADECLTKGGSPALLLDVIRGVSGPPDPRSPAAR